MLYNLLIDRLSITAKSDELDERMNAIWNIFYHLYIPERDLRLLQEHAQTISDLSLSKDAWASSKYDKFIQFLSESTLASTRHYWLEYARCKDLTSTENIGFEQRARDAINSTRRQYHEGRGPIIHGIRSAGAHLGNALKTKTLAFEAFWKTGVAGGNEQDKQSLGNQGKGQVNPMFAVSSAPWADTLFTTEMIHCTAFISQRRSTETGRETPLSSELFRLQSFNLVVGVIVLSKSSRMIVLKSFCIAERPSVSVIAYSLKLLMK